MAIFNSYVSLPEGKFYPNSFSIFMYCLFMSGLGGSKMGPVESVLKAPAHFPAMNICLLAPNYAARACKCHKCNGEHDGT
jgi:hypothetical protein